MWTLHYEPKRTVVLRDAEGQELGRLVRPGPFGRKAEVITAGGVYTVAPKRLFSSALTVRYGDLPVLEVRYGWSAIMVHRADTGVELVRLVRPSLLSSERQLLDAQERLQAKLKVRTNWKRLDMEHQLTKVAQPPPEPLHLLVVLQGLHVQHRRNSAAST